MKKTLFILALLPFAFTAVCHADGLGTLMQVGKSMDEIQRAYDKETGTYNRVRESIGKGEIKKGLTQAALLKYGEPVVVVTEVIRKRQIWVYRPGTTDLLKKPKIRLFFDDNGALDEINVIE
ncbi:MAG: hypothetical protein A2879_03640 [Omnitrophica WOR_2 bacterium RIFCSPHIGHO2_01_FULL_49_10]|nr:MAG: hypothetical protein A2879_03640 [Omnitrophica WOR_2 bacterium RIFCSPHIGHO2_01_FULL_49_10]